MIEGVVVVGDLLRPNGDGSAGGTDGPTVWLFNAVKRQIGLAAACPVSVLTASTMPEAADWLASARAAPEADTFWASRFGALLPGDAIGARLAETLRGRFCLGYEMPPWLRVLLDEIGVPYLDVRLHPIRFMDDLMFAVRASRADTQAQLLQLAVPESAVVATAGLREAMCRLISEARVPDNTLLIAGQRRFDSTQIVNGTFFDAMNDVAAIHALCARYDAVVLKPHPLDRYHSLLIVASGAPTPIFGVIDDNIYRMMSLPQISAVLTVNSSVGQEASYFGKTVHTLAPWAVKPLWNGSAPADGTHVSLGDIVLTPDFWRIVLAPHRAVSAPDGMRLPAKPNRLRIALDSFWNYQEIDTDRIPRVRSTG